MVRVSRRTRIAQGPVSVRDIAGCMFIKHVQCSKSLTAIERLVGALANLTSLTRRQALSEWSTTRFPLQLRHAEGVPTNSTYPTHWDSAFQNLRFKGQPLSMTRKLGRTKQLRSMAVVVTTCTRTSGGLSVERGDSRVDYRLGRTTQTITSAQHNWRMCLKDQKRQPGAWVAFWSGRENQSTILRSFSFVRD